MISIIIRNYFVGSDCWGMLLLFVEGVKVVYCGGDFWVGCDGLWGG